MLRVRDARSHIRMVNTRTIDIAPSILASDFSRLGQEIEAVERGLNVRVEIDGDIDRTNIAEVVAAGAEIIVVGSAFFGSPDPQVAVRDLREATVEWA